MDMWVEVFPYVDMGMLSSADRSEVRRRNTAQRGPEILYLNFGFRTF